MTETIATYSVEPSDDHDFTPEEIQAIADGAITSDLTELEQINLKVAAIAFWENVELWNPKLAKKTFVGTNKKFPHLGIFVPDYTSDLNAAIKVFEFLDIEFELTRLPIAPNGAKQYIAYSGNANRQKHLTSPAIALCKLLLELAPNLPKPDPEVKVIDDDGEIDEPTVIEATFE